MPRNPNKIDYSKGWPEGFEAFSQLEDPRGSGKTRHHFGEVIFMAYTAIVCGVSTFELMEEFCESNEEWFKKWLKLPHGTPSNDTFSRVFEAIDPNVFNQCIVKHLKQFGIEVEPQQFAIDGKTLRGSSNSEDKHLHAVSAWACNQGVTIAQTFTSKKSNEITAIPELLKLLNIENSVITIDAMGTQREIVELIVDKNGDYVLCVKGNQKALLDEIVDQFEFASKNYNRNKLNRKNWSLHLSEEVSRNREEQRFCLVCHNLDWMQKSIKSKWKALKSVVMVERKVKFGDGSSRREVAFYMSSLDAPASEMQKYIRNHWQIENSCHWVIDTVFKEDANQVSLRKSGKNLSTMRRIAHNTLKLAPEISKTKKPASLTKKQLRASQDLTYREICLFGSPV